MKGWHSSTFGGANLIGSMNEPIKMSEPIKMFELMQRISQCNISKMYYLMYYLYVLSQSKYFNYWNATELTFRKCSCRRP